MSLFQSTTLVQQPPVANSVAIQVVSRVVLLAVSLLLASASQAEELRVHAPVIGVAPITQSPPPICDVPAPDRSAGLGAMLRWDLQGRCRPTEEPLVVTGYEVEYEWDGRRFTTVLSEPPQGDTLALKLRIE